MDVEKSEEKKLHTKNPLALREEEILEFWKTNKIFEKSLLKPSPKGEFVFYDGPPFATGLPHYGHILPGTIKDVIPRFKTMQGYHVPRRWGWDCHGLPVENLVEKELGLKTKKDILEYGIGKFNDVAREHVMRYASDWRRLVPRFGRWVDMENDYRTMDTSYTESVWWAFKNLEDKGLVYEGFKSMQLCPRCETTLSNFEVNQGYKDVSDISVYVKFELVDEPNTFFIAWTTTPWTLPGNVALAIHSETIYVKVEVLGVNYIVAKDRLTHVFKEKEEVKVVKEYKGSDLIGKAYKPVFNYYANDSKLKNKENGWKVYGADFVTTENGTGIVHIAPAFGEEDLVLGQKNNLPFVQHVLVDGTMKSEVTDFAGLHVKPKGEDKVRLATDILVLKYLQEHGSFFAKEKVVHSYAHCWRCETPLLNYASSSWFVKVTDFKDKLVSQNKQVGWVPKDIRDGRFGNWLSGARDWAISRSRFWGAPIPVWRCEVCAKKETISSIRELKTKLKPRNTYYVMRHGEADNNILQVISSDVGNPHHLTIRGKEQVRKVAESLRGKKIDLVFSSPFVRTRETTTLLTELLDIPTQHISMDDRIREVRAGRFNLLPIEKYHEFFVSDRERFVKPAPNGESYSDVKKRMTEFIYDIDTKHEGKTILIVTHDSPAWFLFAGAYGYNEEETLAMREGSKELFIRNAEVKELRFVPVPHNLKYEIDLHRPNIDAVSFSCACGGKMFRVPEVFDCWFESGSMPYAEAHYPFDKKAKNFNPKSGFFRKTVGFPADFIAEGLDQTRGWFYSMLVLSTALFGKSPYKNVVVNGTILAEDGQKMSKRLHNYPDPTAVIDLYSMDALRYYLLSSPAVKGQDVYFSEKGVDEVMKKVSMRLNNVHSFYEMYAPKEVLESESVSMNVLDVWIRARLNELISEVEMSFEKYEFDRATRAIGDFIEDLSTWYLRRSRDRFKGDDMEDKKRALTTTRFVLCELSKVMAPCMPFISEDLYQKVKGVHGRESVHLEDWPKISGKKDTEVISQMKIVRQVVTLSLEARAKANIKVRQPLSKLSLKDQKLKGKTELIFLVQDEVNVKEIAFDQTLSQEVSLDTTITDSLKEEGLVRDFIRSVQDLRKQSGRNAGEMVSLVGDEKFALRDLVMKNKELIFKTTSVNEIIFSPFTQDQTFLVENFPFQVKK